MAVASRRGRWGRELADLIAEQAEELAREERTAKLPRAHSGFIRFSELPAAELQWAEAGGRDALDRPAPRQWARYLGGLDPHHWDAAAHLSSTLLLDPQDPQAHAYLHEHFRERSFPIACPVCLERPLPKGWYCLACDRAGLDDLAEDPGHPFEYRGFDVDQWPDWPYREEYGLMSTSYAPGKLKGGVGH
jgi:hypothetical protein